VLRIAAAFATLGDHDVTVQALRMARRLPGGHPARLVELESQSPATSVF